MVGHGRGADGVLVRRVVVARIEQVVAAGVLWRLHTPPRFPPPPPPGVRLPVLVVLHDVERGGRRSCPRRRLDRGCRRLDAGLRGGREARRGKLRRLRAGSWSASARRRASNSGEVLGTASISGCKHEELLHRLEVDGPPPQGGDHGGCAAVGLGGEQRVDQAVVGQQQVGQQAGPHAVARPLLPEQQGRSAWPHQQVESR